MVKGISRQVILVRSPDPKLFEQAIFILKEDALRDGITDDLLLKEARRAVREPEQGGKRHFYLYGAFWAAVGALLMGIAWLLTALL